MKILVVDDEALLVKGIRFNLKNGYKKTSPYKFGLKNKQKGFFIML